MASGIDDLIDAVYRAGADPSEWMDVLVALTRRLNGRHATIHLGNTDFSGFSFGLNYNHDPEALVAYAAHYFKINPLNPPLTRVQAGTALGHHELVPVRDYRRTEFYQEFSRRYDLEGSATAVLAQAGGQITCLGVTRENGSDPFTRGEISILQRLVPHLQRALDLNRKLALLRNELNDADAALALLDFGVIFLGMGGTVVRSNTFAEEILKQANGLAVRDGRIVATDLAANTILFRLVGEATYGSGERGGTMAVPRKGKHRPLLARVMPHELNRDPLGLGARAILMVRDPDSRAANTVSEVAKAYRLTPTETRVVAALLDTPEINRVADKLGIQEVTVRNHLAHILAKTGTNKQAELVSLILSTRLPLRH
jgi:DNA-binding CsgD family transcriptional regulator